MEGLNEITADDTIKCFLQYIHNKGQYSCAQKNKLHVYYTNTLIWMHFRSLAQIREAPQRRMYVDEHACTPFKMMMITFD